jgi:sarcosine oxidase
MQTINARNVVLGAGAMGSATAYHLARRGEPVLLVEQFALGHDRGSSHGAARITRHSYADTRYARLMPEAFQAWRTLEADAGMLAAARCVAAEVELARRFGGEKTRVVENCRVRRIDLDANRPTLITETGKIVADRLIVTAGPWLPRLVPGLPVALRPERQQVVYFRPADPAPFQPGRFPVFIVKGETKEGEINDYYGMPPFLDMGVKVARHGGPEVDPDQVDRNVGDEYRAIIRRFLRGYIPALAEAPIDAAEVCLYTVAPDEQFQLGPLPGRTDVIVASPCSGHGFKFSCLIGRILADLATTGQTAIDIASWQFAASGHA